MPALEISQAHILRKYIIAQLLMTLPSAGGNWPLFTGHMPDMDADCGCVYSTAGVLDAKLLRSGEVIEKLGAQIMIRSTNYETAFAKMEAIVMTLDAAVNVNVAVSGNNYTLQNASRKTPIVPLGAEKGTADRLLFSVNFLLTIKKV